MRQAKALLIILAVLSTPLALFAAVNSCAPAACSFCAAMHDGNMAASECPMNKKAHLPDPALASPLAPTAPVPFFHIAAPAPSRGGSPLALDAHLSFGFSAPPFIPPQS